jgi:hypothetical protein
VSTRLKEAIWSEKEADSAEALIPSSDHNAYLDINIFHSRCFTMGIGQILGMALLLTFLDAAFSVATLESPVIMSLRWWCEQVQCPGDHKRMALSSGFCENNGGNEA